MKNQTRRPGRRDAGRHRSRLPRQAGHHRRAVRGRRPHRQGGARPRRGAAQAAQHQTVIVENVGGAGGTLGANKVAKAAPDGHTLLLHHIGMATAPALYRKLPYDTLDDFEYLGMVSDVPMTLIGRPTLPASNFAELAQVDDRQQGQDQPRQRRPGRRLAPVRPAVPAGDGRRHDDRAVQGHGAGDDRPAGRPGRPHVRPDDQHHRPDRGRQGQGLRRDHAQATDDAGAAQPADARRAGPEGLQRRRSGTACTRPRARPSRCSTSSTRRCARR